MTKPNVMVYLNMQYDIHRDRSFLSRSETDCQGKLNPPTERPMHIKRKGEAGRESVNRDSKWTYCI